MKRNNSSFQQLLRRAKIDNNKKTTTTNKKTENNNSRRSAKIECFQFCLENIKKKKKHECIIKTVWIINYLKEKTKRQQKPCISIRNLKKEFGNLGILKILKRLKLFKQERRSYFKKKIKQKMF